MSRPKKPDEECRTEHIAVRLTLSERVRLEAEAARAAMTITEFARTRMLEGRIVVRQTRELSPRHVLELGRVGVNLNQIARALNSQEPVPQQIVLSAVKDLGALLRNIVAADQINAGPGPGL